VVAGSAAYGVGEAFRWPTGLDRAPKEARAFYATIAAATAVGVLMNFSPIDPIKLIRDPHDATPAASATPAARQK